MIGNNPSRQEQRLTSLLLFSCLAILTGCGSHSEAGGHADRQKISPKTADAFGTTFATAAAVPSDGTPVPVNRTDNSLVNEAATPVAIEPR